MSYKGLINTNVARAFNLLKDLAEDVTLSKKTDNTFDFSTMTATETVATAIPTKAVVTDSNKSSLEKNSLTKIMLLKTQDIGDISLYDKVSYKSASWVIGPSILSDGYVTIVEVTKEV